MVQLPRFYAATFAKVAPDLNKLTLVANPGPLSLVLSFVHG
jgi:hypothetical protein